MNLPQLSTGLVALALSAVLTPIVMIFMTRVGMVDRPDGRRKLHGRAVPIAGGLAIWLSVVVAVSAGHLVGGPALPEGEESFWLTFLLSSCVLCLVGLADDAWNLRGRHKFLGQMAAVGVLISGGGVEGNMDLFGCVGVLGAINAMNLLDGMDGLAATIGGMLGLALAVMADMMGHPVESMVAAALVGGVLGFLVYNFPPARIFMGDTGSMLIGLALGVIAVRASLKSSATIALAAPVAIWTLPILDASMAILRRKLTGRSILIPDRAHLHHRLAERGFGPRKSLMFIGSLCAITTAGALGSVYLHAEWLAPAVAVAVTAFLAWARVFGHSEFALLVRRSRLFAQSLLPFRSNSGTAREHRSRLQGTKEWDQLWDSLVTFAERCGLDSVQLSVSLPLLHEEFFAGWDRGNPVEGGRVYRADIPLSSAAHGSIGSLRISGRCLDHSACAWVGELIEGLRPFESQIADLLTSGTVPLPESDTFAAAPRPTAILERRPLRVPALATAVPSYTGGGEIGLNQAEEPHAM